MPDHKFEVLDALKQEMIAAWAYLYAYVELFEHSDPKRVQLLEKTAPTFFALVQSSLIECVLIRLARLMDPQESGNKQNLSFSRFFCLCAESQDFAEINAQFAVLCRDWNGAKFQPLKEHRNKVQAHNDLPTIKGTHPSVSTKMTVDDVRFLRELFCSLWKVLATANSILNGTALVEPQPWPLGIFSYLSAGGYLEKHFENHPELIEDYCKFEFHGTGRDTPMRLID